MSTDKVTVTIAAPKFETVAFPIVGTAPFVARKFSQKAQQIIRDGHEAGGTSRAKKKRDPIDYQAMYEEAKHISDEGWCGIPAPAFRAAMVRAAVVGGFVMTRAKLAVFIEADGFDNEEGTPLVRITKGEPERHDGYGRDARGGVSLSSRPLWRAGWEAVVRVTFDADMLTATDVGNLLSRAGLQVGVGEGRPYSKDSTGCGWGTFAVKDVADAAAT